MRMDGTAMDEGALPLRTTSTPARRARRSVRACERRGARRAMPPRRDAPSRGAAPAVIVWLALLVLPCDGVAQSDVDLAKQSQNPVAT